MAEQLPLSPATFAPIDPQQTSDATHHSFSVAAPEHEIFRGLELVASGAVSDCNEDMPRRCWPMNLHRHHIEPEGVRRCISGVEPERD